MRNFTKNDKTMRMNLKKLKQLKKMNEEIKAYKEIFELYEQLFAINGTLPEQKKALIQLGEEVAAKDWGFLQQNAKRAILNINEKINEIHKLIEFTALINNGIN